MTNISSMDFNIQVIRTRQGFLQAILLLAGFIALSLLLLSPARAQKIEYDLQTTSVLRINLPVSQAVTIVLSDPVGKIVAADPNIADAQPITDNSIYLVGRSFGTTTVNLYSEDGVPVGLLAVEVGVDTIDIARSIRSALPQSDVKVNTVNGRVQLSGSVSDAYSLEKVLAIVDQYGSPAVVNTITLKGGQQVNLEVRILEAQRNAGRELGIQWGGSVGAVNVAIGGGAQNPAANAGSFATFITSVLSGVSGVSLNATISALEAKSLVRTLAEPNLTTLSGVTASFLAGGQVPIRVNDANGNSTLTYRDFGVRLEFTPIVLDNGRIQIQLSPEVSSIGSFTATGDPVFNTRTLNATVELRDGQSFSVAGLLQNDTNLRQNQLPWIGEVPVLGSLFKSSSYQKKETELVIIVTPRLVQPAVPGQVLASPLDSSAPANDVQFFGLGQMEVSRQMQRNFVSGAGVSGPFGYIIDLGPDGSEGN